MHRIPSHTYFRLMKGSFECCGISNPDRDSMPLALRVHSTLDRRPSVLEDDIRNGLLPVGQISTRIQQWNHAMLHRQITPAVPSGNDENARPSVPHVDPLASARLHALVSTNAQLMKSPMVHAPVGWPPNASHPV